MLDREHEGQPKRSRGRLIRAVTRPPFHDPLGRKPWLERIARAGPHLVRRISLNIPGWPQWSRGLKVAFLSDFHTGSHSGDVARLERIVEEARTFNPDLVLFGGDFVNLQLFGGGRVPPQVIAAVLERLGAPCGRFAVLGNHDYIYGAEDIAAALHRHGIAVLDHERRAVAFENANFDILGIPDARVQGPRSREVLSALSPTRPTIVLAHDPVWFADVPAGPHLTLAGHTHGGQVRLPVLGVVKNSSEAPLRWSHGLIFERGQYLYVTSGIGTSIVPWRWRVPPEIVALEVTGTSTEPFGMGPR
jgi:predicted MPP superfamily phosphohydrolase